MKIQVEHELASYELAHALALNAELQDFKTPEEAESWMKRRTKTDVKQIAKDRCFQSGQSESWPPLEGEELEVLGGGGFDLLRAARDRVDALWPKGA